MTAARGAVIALCGVQFVDVLGVTSAITAIPSILRAFSAPAEVAGLLATVYAALFGGLLVLGSRLGDRYGPRRILLAGIGLFTAVAVVAGTAQQVGQLLVGVALQGTAAALGVPCALRLLLQVAGDRGARRTGLALWGATGAVAGVLGYLVGGLLTEAFGRRAVYVVNAPVGLALLAAVVLLVPDVAAPDRERRLDLPRAGLLLAAVAALVVGAALLEDAGTRTTGGTTLVAGTLLVAAFAGQQRRAAAPLLPRAAVYSPNLRTGLLMSFANTASTSSAGVLATLLLQQQLGFSPLAAAWTLMPFSLAVVAGSALSRPLAARVLDTWAGCAGLGGIAAGNAVLALSAGSVAGLVAGIVVAGIGLGVAAVAATSLSTRVGDDLVGSATGLLNTAAQLGTALGVAAVVTLATAAGPPNGTSVGWAAGGGLAALAGLVVLLTSPGSPHPTSRGPRASRRSWDGTTPAARRAPAGPVADPGTRDPRPHVTPSGKEDR